MDQINQKRLFHRNDIDPDPDGEYVLYWMQIFRRFQYNYALEYAVEQANELGKPLLIYEGLNVDYPWACDRIHHFMMQGMKENLDYAQEKELNYVSFVEDDVEAGKGLLYNLAENAASIITDEYPVFIMRQHNERLPDRLGKRYTTVDSNGIIPLGVTEKDPYSAYFYRKIMQKNFVECYTSPPLKNPLENLENRSKVTLPESFTNRYPSAEEPLSDIDSFIADLPFRHDIGPVKFEGTRETALGKLGGFVSNRLGRYDDHRNDPDEKATSGLSPWLHFGKISEYEIVNAILDHQPEGWDLDKITFNKGSTPGFFNGDDNVDAFLDEVITWREVGYHFAHHRPDYDEYESLPDWALKTLEKHRDDPREHIYSYEELALSQTHDEIWNAAMTELREEGTMHNYLRMLWGKNVIKWTPDPETALQYLIDLNNQYAIDGRDANSYSGIFWCFGRFDRAWQERDVLGKVRYMTSDSTRKKVKLKEYMARYGNGNS